MGLGELGSQERGNFYTFLVENEHYYWILRYDIND